MAGNLSRPIITENRLLLPLPKAADSVTDSFLPYFLTQVIFIIIYAISDGKFPNSFLKVRVTHMLTLDKKSPHEHKV